MSSCTLLLIAAPEVLDLQAADRDGVLGVVDGRHHLHDRLDADVGEVDAQVAPRELPGDLLRLPVVSRTDSPTASPRVSTKRRSSGTFVR